MNERKSFQYVKQRNGITLIALVISIIVMLILAGVSLNAVIRRQWNNYSGTKCNIYARYSSFRRVFANRVCKIL